MGNAKTTREIPGWKEQIKTRRSQDKIVESLRSKNFSELTESDKDELLKFLSVQFGLIRED